MLVDRDCKCFGEKKPQEELFKAKEVKKEK